MAAAAGLGALPDSLLLEILRLLPLHERLRGGQGLQTLAQAGTGQDALEICGFKALQGIGYARSFQIKQQTWKALNPCGEIYCASWQQLPSLPWADIVSLWSYKSKTSAKFREINSSESPSLALGMVSGLFV
nr:uncharacterized protein LOC101953873 [Chrysemys picta bellii]